MTRLLLPCFMTLAACGYDPSAMFTGARGTVGDAPALVLTLKGTTPFNDCTVALNEAEGRFVNDETYDFEPGRHVLPLQAFSGPVAADRTDAHPDVARDVTLDCADPAYGQVISRLS